MMPSLLNSNPNSETEGGTMTKTRRELEIEANSQRIYAHEAQQKAEDVGYALEMVLNNRVKLFYTNTTSNNSKHEFLFGIAKNAPVDDIPGVLKTGDTREDRRIIIWKTTLESGYVIGSAYHDREFKSSPEKFDGQDTEVKKLLLEAIQQLPEIRSS
jgi:hypothetical protein